MIQIMLSGLVLNKIITLEEAELILIKLKDVVVPKTVEEVLEKINKVRDETKNS